MIMDFRSIFGQIIATKPPLGHPLHGGSVRDSPQNPLISGLGTIVTIVICT